MNRKLINMTLAAAMLTSLLAAQTPSKADLGAALAANGAQLAGYQWKQTVTVMRHGEPMPPLIEAVRVDAGGNLMRTTIVKPPEKKAGPLLARKIAAAKELIQGAMQLAGRYANPQTLGQAIQQGEIAHSPAGALVQVRSLLVGNDEVTMYITGKQPFRVEVKTQYQDRPVLVRIVYRQLASGPNVASMMTVQLPGEDLVVTVDSTDHRSTPGF